MVEGQDVDLPEPDDRFRPQVPAWLYYAVILEADGRLPIDAWRVSWWKALAGLMESQLHQFDRELYEELLEEESDDVREHRQRY